MSKQQCKNTAEDKLWQQQKTTIYKIQKLAKQLVKCQLHHSTLSVLHIAAQFMLTTMFTNIIWSLQFILIIILHVIAYDTSYNTVSTAGLRHWGGPMQKGNGRPLPSSSLPSFPFTSLLCPTLPFLPLEVGP